MKLAVTGALGHIGSRFIHSLKAGQYDRVLLIDDLSAQRQNSLFHLPEGVPFRFVEADVCAADLRPLFEGMDAVIHLAAITNAAASFDMEEKVRRVNYQGTRAVARACAALGSKLVLISTTSIYGTQAQVVDEQCSAEDLRPQSPYATSKLQAEQELASLGHSAGLRFVTCRFGTIFGISPGMRFHTAINKFVWQACVGQPITVWTTALHQRRPYLDVSDAVRALDFIVKTGRFDNEIYNVLTTNATVSDIVEIIRSYVGDLQVRHVDSTIMNQLSYTVACEKFKSLGFRFQGDLHEAIGETVRLIRNARQWRMANDE